MFHPIFSRPTSVRHLVYCSSNFVASRPIKGANYVFIAIRAKDVYGCGSGGGSSSLRRHGDRSSDGWCTRKTRSSPIHLARSAIRIEGTRRKKTVPQLCRRIVVLFTASKLQYATPDNSCTCTKNYDVTPFTALPTTTTRRIPVRECITPLSKQCDVS